MKTGDTKLRIDHVPVDETGTKVEPEEQPVTEITTMPVDVAVADHAALPGEVPAVGAFGGLMSVESTAGEVAQNTATRCELCEYWRHEDWTRHLDSIEGTPEGDKQLDKMRGELLGFRIGQGDNRRMPEDADFLAVNIAIHREFAICAAFTESSGEVSVTPFYGACPIDDTRFKMRDRESKRIASAGYDKILKIAQGRDA